MGEVWKRLVKKTSLSWSDIQAESDPCVKVWWVAIGDRIVHNLATSSNQVLEFQKHAPGRCSRQRRQGPLGGGDFEVERWGW